MATYPVTGSLTFPNQTIQNQLYYNIDNSRSPNDSSTFQAISVSNSEKLQSSQFNINEQSAKYPMFQSYNMNYLSSGSPLLPITIIPITNPLETERKSQQLELMSSPISKIIFRNDKPIITNDEMNKQPNDTYQISNKQLKNTQPIEGTGQSVGMKDIDAKYLEKEQTIKILENEIRELRNLLSKLEQKINNSTPSQINEDKMNQQLVLLSAENERLSLELLLNKQSQENQKREIEQLSQLLVTSKGGIQPSVDATLLLKEKEVETLKGYVKALENDLAILHKRIDDQHMKESIGRRIEAIHFELVEKSKKQTITIQELEGQKQENNRELSKTRGHCELLLQENRKLQMALEERMQQNQELFRKQEELQNSQKAKQDIEELMHQIAELKNINSLQAQQNGKLLADKKDFESRENRLGQRINELECEFETVNNSVLKRKRTETEFNEKVIADNAKKNEQFSREIEELMKDKQIKELKILDIEGKLKESKEVIENQLKKENALKRDIKEQQIQIDELKQQVKDKLEAIDQIENSCKKTTAEYYLKWQELDNIASTKNQEIHQLQQKIFLLMIENSRVHSVLKVVQNESQHVQETAKSISIVASEFKAETERLEKQDYNYRNSNKKVDELNNRLALMSKAYEDIQIKLIESENIRNQMRIQSQDHAATLKKNKQLQTQIAFLAQENNRVQKLILGRCKQSTDYW